MEYDALLSCERQRIKQVIEEAYMPEMRNKFPSSTPDVPAHSGDPSCPIGVDFLILNIQVTLLQVRDKYALQLFRQLYEQGIPLGELARRQRMHHEAIMYRIDRMLDDAICRMTQRTAQMILSVYWMMHEDKYLQQRLRL